MTSNSPRYYAAVQVDSFGLTPTVCRAREPSRPQRHLMLLGTRWGHAGGSEIVWEGESLAMDTKTFAAHHPNYKRCMSLARQKAQELIGQQNGAPA